MNVFEAMFPYLWKKKCGDSFSHKKVGMPNFIGFWAKHRNKVGTYISLPWSPSIVIWNMKFSWSLMVLGASHSTIIMNVQQIKNHLTVVPLPDNSGAYAARGCWCLGEMPCGSSGPDPQGPKNCPPSVWKANPGGAGHGGNQQHQFQGRKGCWSAQETEV